jgi:hypothetical protein
MRYIIILILLISGADFLAAQSIHNESASGKVTAFSDEKNFIVNLHGGILQATEIKKGDDKSYWIKKGQFVNKNNTVVIDFNDKLYVNNKPFIDQVNAKYGYILFFSDGYDYVLVYLIDENGNLNSDELYINLR